MSAVNNGPQIVKNSLVLNLDAGNSKSYSTNRFQALGTGLTTENVLFAINGNGTFQRVAAGTVVGGYKIKPNDVVYSYALGNNGCHYHGNTTPIPSGVYATFSFDYLVTGATNYPSTNYLANFENYGGSALGGSVAAANSLQDVWQRATFTSGPTTGTGTQAMFLYPGGCSPSRLADSGTIYFRNPKVEFTNTDTGNSTFSSTSNISIWYDLSGNGYNGTLTNGATSNISNLGTVLFDGVDDYVVVSNSSGLQITSALTLEMWFYNTSSVNGLGVMVKGPINNDYDYMLYLTNNSNGVYFYKKDSAGNAHSGGISLSLLNRWLHIVVTHTSLGLYTMYVNGVASDSATFTNATIRSSSNNLYIGAGWSSYFYGKIGLSRIYNRALTASEVLQNYEATKTRFGL